MNNTSSTVDEQHSTLVDRPVQFCIENPRVQPVRTQIFLTHANPLLLKTQPNQPVSYLNLFSPFQNQPKWKPNPFNPF